MRNVDVATADRSETSDLRQERERELRAALAGIEASAERLSSHRELLTDQQLDELTRSLAHEARLLRLLLEVGTAAVNPSDTDVALGPERLLRPTSGPCAPPRRVRPSRLESR